MMLATDAPKTNRQWTGSPTFDFRPSDFRLLHKKNRRNPKAATVKIIPYR
jgi:hypothetical protein